jgi:citrate synthase
MGMGHREYRLVDPRAAILKPMAESLCSSGAHRHNYRILAELERNFNARMKQKGRDIWANVEFYKGAVFEAIDIPQHYFTAMFVLARSVGWLAHLLESRLDNKLIRPKALYVGVEPRSLG